MYHHWTQSMCALDLNEYNQQVSYFQIIVAGPAGCGKSECIKTFALAERERGKVINVQTVFTKSVESDELLGFWHPTTK